MYAQIFLGIWMLINAVFHLSKRQTVLRKSVVNNLSEEQLVSYQKGLVIPHFILGILFIVMGTIENRNLLSGPAFITIYIVIGCIPLAMILRNNKKHTGYYIW